MSVELLKQFMSDLWHLAKKDIDPDYNDNSFWDGLIDDAGEIDRKYGGDKLVQHLLLGFVDYHEEAAKNDL